MSGVMVTRTLTQAELRSAGIGAFFRPRDIERLGLSFRDLECMVAAGQVEKIGKGLYRLVAAATTEFETIAMVSSAVPSGIVCLLSALRLHDIGTQAPHEVWIAIDRKARKPSRLPGRARVIRFSGAMLSYGVTTRPISGVPVRVTSPARTVVDCFRYRNKVGIDIAIEALRDCVSERKATIAELGECARQLRAENVIRPYLESLIA